MHAQHANECNRLHMELTMTCTFEVSMTVVFVLVMLLLITTASSAGIDLRRLALQAYAQTIVL